MKEKKKNFWKYATFALIVIFAIAIVAINNRNQSCQSIGKDEAAKKAIDFINKNILPPTTKAVLENVERDGCLYKMAINIGGQKLETYLTMDGNLLFPQAIDLNTKLQPRTTTPQQEQSDLPKTEKPKVELFIMSYCPFGIQSLKGIIPVVKLLKNKIDFSLEFVDYAMHGEKEVYENLRMYCIEKEQQDKLLDYLECFVKDGNSERCLDEVNIDKDSLKECMDKTDKEYGITESLNDRTKWAGGRFPPFTVHTEPNKKYGVRGSPTLVINGQVARSGRDPASYLSTICSAFTEEPEECSMEVSTQTPSPGFGGGTGGSSGGNCG